MGRKKKKTNTGLSAEERQALRDRLKNRTKVLAMSRKGGNPQQTHRLLKTPGTTDQQKLQMLESYDNDNMKKMKAKKAKEDVS